jgi:hypothetical protein
VPLVHEEEYVSELPDLGSCVLTMPGSDRLSDAVSGFPEMVERMTARSVSALDPGIVTITEAFDGPIFSVWREGRMVCSSNDWLAAAPVVRRRLAALLPTEDVELIVGHPREYAGYSTDDDLFLLELRVGGQRVSWEEMSIASKLVPHLHLEHVLWREREGISVSEAIRAVGIAGSMRYKKDPRRLVYWLDIGRGASAKNAALGMYLYPLPKMSYEEQRFFRSFGILPRFNDRPAIEKAAQAATRHGSAPDQMGRMDEDLSKLSPKQLRQARMRAAQVILRGV